MRRLKKKLKTLSISLAAILSGCSDPNVDLCGIYTNDPDVNNWVLVCKNIKTEVESEVKLRDANGYISVSPTDYQRLREWHQDGCSD